MARFSREVDLRDPVARWLVESAGMTVIADEIDSGHGVADLVGASDFRLVDRVNAGVPALANMLQVQLIGRLQEPVSEEALRAWAPHGWRGLERRGITPLVEAGVVRFDDAVGGWCLRRRVPAPFDGMVAVELKLRDVRRAIVQAARYRLFAQQSYVAVPMARTSGNAVELVERSALGLLGVGADGRIEEVVPAPRRRPIDVDTTRLVSERVFAAMSCDGPRPLAGSPRGRPDAPALLAV